MKNLLIVDVSGFVYRNHFAFSKHITNGGSFGALRTILKLVNELKITGIILAFDSRRENLKRSKKFPSYKQNRKPTPSSLIEQIKTFQMIAYKMGITCIQMEGYEADDLIWTSINLLENDYDKIYVATSDKDLQQVLVNDKIIIVSDGKIDKMVTRDDYIKKHNILPEQLPDLFGLIGDSSDNIPGVNGIGEQTAYKLIQKYKSLENVLEAKLDDPEISEHIYNILNKSKDVALLSKELATLTICPDIQKLNANFFKNTWGEVFKEYEFKSLVKYAENEEVAEREYLLTESQLLQLGITQDQISTLKEYKNKGALYEVK